MRLPVYAQLRLRGFLYWSRNVNRKTSSILNSKFANLESLQKVFGILVFAKVLFLRESKELNVLSAMAGCMLIA